MMGARIINRRPVVLQNVEGSAEYQRAYEKSARAIREFNEAKRAYRAREIGDTEFLRARAAYDRAMAEYDAAYAAEQEREPNPSLEDQMRKRIRQRLAEGWSLEKIGDRTVWHMYGHLYRIKDGILYVKTARGDEAFGPAIGQPNAPRVTQRDVNYAAASYHNLLMQYGENNMATQRAEWKYRDLQRAYAEQQAKRKASK